MMETMHFRWENDTPRETKMKIMKNNHLKMHLPSTYGDFPASHVSFWRGIFVATFFTKMNGVY